jgi:hypothetical protein
MEIKKGTRVSLNKANRAYYFQGENGINLRAGIEDTAIIPEDISEENLEIIKKSIMRGTLVVGWASEPKPNVKYKEDDKALLEKGVKKMIPFLEEIAKSTGRKEDSPGRRLEQLLAWEKADKNRKTVIQKIEDLLSSIGGVSVVEEDKEKEEVKIDIVE